MPRAIEQALDRFSTPDPRFSPAPLWWWSGQKLEIACLRRQMDQMWAMGIRQVVIINLAPSGTLFGCDPDDPPFLSDPWWDLFAQVCDHARAIGMLLWFYDQIGFSGASYQADIVAAHPQCLGQQLHRAATEGVGPLHVDCPVLGVPFAAYLISLDDPADITPLSITGRSVSATARRPSRLCLIYIQPQGYDFFSPIACDYLLDTVHREFARRLPQHLGSTIIGSFQDELPDLPTWGPTFAASFAAHFGYRLEPVIHHLFEHDASNPTARRTRLHYHAHRAALAEEAFFKPFFHWHEQHGLQCGFDQQSPAREARIIGCVAKYADYIRTHRWYAIPGSDLHGNGKLHASIAFLYNRPRVWIEGFHSTGWGGTLADTFDWLLPYLRSGANFYNPHAIYYATCQGWWEWAPPSTGWRQPYARHYQPFADLIARLTCLLSQGVHQAEIGILFPTATVAANLGVDGPFSAATAADQTLHEIIGSMRWHQAKPGPLDRLGLDYHLLDESTICSAPIVRGALVHRGVAMRTIILPAVRMLDQLTWQRLTDFASAGGRVIAVGSDRIEFADSTTQLGANMAELPCALVIPSADALFYALQYAPRSISAPVPTLYRRTADIHLLFIPAVNGMATKVQWDNWFAPIEHATLDPASYQSTMDIHLPGSAQHVVDYDPRTGKTRPLVTIPTPTGRLLHLDLAGSPFALLAWSEGEHLTEDQNSTPSTPVQCRQHPFPDRWTGSYEPHLTDKDAPAERQMPHTTDFRWRHGASDAGWSQGIPPESPAQIVRATFGPRAWCQLSNATARRPVVYSPQFGIQQDSLHTQTLGPKGHVPDEFIDLGKLTANDTVIIHAGVRSAEARRALLAVGANADKSAIINGQIYNAQGSEYLWITPIQLTPGDNSIQLQLKASRDGTVRLFWCLLHPGAEKTFYRPERLAGPHPIPAGSRVIYRRRFSMETPTNAGAIKISVAAMCSIFLNGVFLGRQGGFDPYRPMMRGQIHAVPALSAGDHELRVELIEPQRPATLMVDSNLPITSGPTVTLASDRHWTITVEDNPPLPVGIVNRQEGDSGAWFLHRRPHPLPAAIHPGRPIQPTSAPTVLNLPLLPPTESPQPQWFEWTIPPGAQSASLNLVDCTQASFWVDGAAVPLSPTWQVNLSTASPSPCRKAVLLVTSSQLGGGVFDSPITYQFGAGRFSIGSWLAQGLRSYSGSIRLRARLTIPSLQGVLQLDLGHVRGTVEVTVNNRSAGVCVIAPYRFDLTPFLHRGSNGLELVVTNTLANYLSTWSPTRWWSPDQLEAGIFGPISLWQTSNSEHQS